MWDFCSLSPALWDPYSGCSTGLTPTLLQAPAQLSHNHSNSPWHPNWTVPQAQVPSCAFLLGAWEVVKPFIILGQKFCFFAYCRCPLLEPKLNVCEKEFLSQWHILYAEEVLRDLIGSRLAELVLSYVTDHWVATAAFTIHKESGPWCHCWAWELCMLLVFWVQGDSLFPLVLIVWSKWTFERLGQI